MAKFEMTAVQCMALECYAKVAHAVHKEHRKNRRRGMLEYRLNYCPDADVYTWDVLLIREGDDEEGLIDNIGFLAGLEILSHECHWPAFGRMPHRFVCSIIGMMRYYHLFDDNDAKDIFECYIDGIEIIQEV